MRVLLCLFAAAAGLRLHSEAEANPIRRVVGFLQKMQEEVQAEAKREGKLFHKFQCFCQKGSGDLKGQLAANDAASAQLKADIDAKSARRAQLDADVEQHRADRKAAEEAIAKATGIRESEKKAYDKNTADLSTDVEAMQKAIAVLEKGMGKSFLQKPSFAAMLKRVVDRSSSLDEMQRSVVTQLLQSPYGDYQASSGEIVGILKEMKDEEDRDLNGAIATEEAAVKAFNELMEAKNAEIAAATANIEKKVVRSGELAVEVAEDKNSLENTQKEMAADAEFLANLGKSCDTKAKEYEERVKERNNELAAIGEAIKVLNDDDALDVFKKTLPSGPSFLQREESPAVEAYSWIQSAAAVSRNRQPQLSLIAMMLKVGKVDFSKILKMIDDMVVHLGKEQQDDTDQLNYCNAELDKHNDQKAALEKNIKDLSATIDELDARIKELKDQIQQLTDRIAETEETMKQATADRKEENANFQQSSVELNAAVQLIGKAKNRLNKFYNPALYKPPPERELTEEERIAQNMGEVLPTEAPKYIAGTKIEQLQMRKDPGAAPETWEGGYKKKTQQSSGVIALMDLLTKDLEVQLQTAQQDEATAQSDYENLISESTAAKNADSKAKGAAESALAQAGVDKEAAIADRKGKNGELATENETISGLHGDCDWLIANYDFRKAARTNEVEALKNAKAVLSGANYS
jgi:uncharacterized coiled-coil DUF342 family protein